MKTGVCTTDFEKLPLVPADALFGRIRELGFGCVQFAFSSVQLAEYGKIIVFFIKESLSHGIPFICDTHQFIRADRKKNDLCERTGNGHFGDVRRDFNFTPEGIREYFCFGRLGGSGIHAVCSACKNAD